jgi:UDP-glucose 4-epimerase
MNKARILVTGGAGYIGSHCCRALGAAGYEPIVYDNLSTGHRSFVRTEMVEGDLVQKELIVAALKKYDVTAVIHFAAVSLVGDSVVDPQTYYLNNIVGTLSLLQAMRETGCSRIVFSSTGAVYGNADSKAVPESFPCNPINPYGASKWMIERILSDYRAAYGFGAFCLRYFNASGADPASDIGEWRTNETHLIPRAMMALQGYIDNFAIFGDDYDTPDKTAVRDYIHVSDLAAAHVAALKLLEEGHLGGSFNLGTGSGFSVREILATIKHVTGRDVPHTVKQRRPGDPTYLVADPSAARETLGFIPNYSDLLTIIETAWTWHQKLHPAKNELVKDSGL